MKPIAYPQYKDSGIEWLGRMPAHWEARRLKLLAGINDEALGEDTDLDYEISYVDIGNVDATRGILEKESYRFEDAPSRARRVVRHGDVIVSTVRTYLRAIAPIEKPAPNLVVSTGFAVIRPGDVLDSHFAAYLLRAPYFVERVVADSVGVSYPAINASQLGTFGVAVPGKDEQQAIADFLDRETAKIDALTEKKEQLIELLQEKRTALITHAVTKGLDPDVPMKDSCIEWLGQIPAHWEIRRLKHIIAEPLKYGANEAAELDDPDLPRYVRITDIDDSDALRDETFRSLPTDIAEPYLLEPGDLLFARSGATAGKTFLYQESWGVCAYAGYLIRARLDRRLVRPRFARYFTASTTYWQWLSSAFIQATIQNVSAEKYADLQVPIPPLAEQDSMLDVLDRETAKIGALIAKIEEAVERLKEYRTALISAAVTGKIDVREEGG